MGVSFDVPKAVVWYSGVFDWDTLYKKMVNWHWDRQFELKEKQYKAKPGGSEIEITYVGERKETSYVKFVLTTYLHMWDMQEVEIIEDGVKKKMSKARFSISITGNIEMDWQNRFEETKFLRKLRGFFHQFVFSAEKDMGYYWDKMAYNLLNYEQALKEQLNVNTKYSSYVMTTY